MNEKSKMYKVTLETGVVILVKTFKENSEFEAFGRVKNYYPEAKIKSIKEQK